MRLLYVLSRKQIFVFKDSKRNCLKINPHKFKGQKDKKTKRRKDKKQKDKKTKINIIPICLIECKFKYGNYQDVLVDVTEMNEWWEFSRLILLLWNIRLLNILFDKEPDKKIQNSKTITEGWFISIYVVFDCVNSWTVIFRQKKKIGILLSEQTVNNYT